MKMEIIDKIKMIIKEPTKFFSKIRSEQEYKEPFLYYALLSFIFSILSTAVSFLTGLSNDIVFTFIGLWISFLILIFLGTAVIHIFVYLFGGRGGYLNSFKSATYAATPALLLGWIPIIEFIAGIYSAFYLYPKGLSILHDISFVRAFLAVLLPAVIIISTILILAVVGIFPI